LFSVAHQGFQQNLSNKLSTWCQFHQHFTLSFYARRSQKHKKDLTTWLRICIFALMVSAHVKAACKMLVKLPWDLKIDFDVLAFDWRQLIILKFKVKVPNRLAVKDFSNFWKKIYCNYKLEAHCRCCLLKTRPNIV